MSLSDRQLVQKAQRGDVEAFEELVYRYDRKVLGIAYSFRNDEDDAQDIYQEVFLRAYKGLKNFKRKSEFSTWLFRITTNVCISFGERKMRRANESLDKEIFRNEEGSETLSDRIAGSERTDRLIDDKELSERIQRALNTLPERQKLAFTLKHYNGMKIFEIAEYMGTAEGTVKRYLFNATQKLREKLKHLNN